MVGSASGAFHSHADDRGSVPVMALPIVFFFPTRYGDIFFSQPVSMLSRDAYVTHSPGVGVNRDLSHLPLSLLISALGDFDEHVILYFSSYHH